MYSASWCSLFLLVLPALVSSLPVPVSESRALSGRSAQKKGFVLPLRRQRRSRFSPRALQQVLAGSIGLGDYVDMYYSVSTQVGTSTTALNLDTGSSDLWVMSDACRTQACTQSTSAAYSTASFDALGTSVNLTYGDSTSGTFASGPVGLETVTLAGLEMQDQVIAAINDTDNSAVSEGSAGIMGLGFPAESVLQSAVVDYKFNDPATTDDFLNNIGSYGPLVTRLVQTGVIDQPLFAVTLQRDMIDVSGSGQLTIGQLPEGVSNDSLTWVPVRLYSPADGGLAAPSFAPDEVYPLRWEVPIENVFLDGVQLATSTEQPNGVTDPGVSALIDTGNSIVRGPADVVGNILSAISPAYAANAHAQPTFPCATPHTLAFQIGGALFPVDPRDLAVQAQAGNSSACVASTVVAADAPAEGALYAWSLGDVFLKSTLAAFYYGNLTHPSVDPPRIGFRSLVPANASALMQQAVAQAADAGGVFSSTVQAAPTASTVVQLGVTQAPVPYAYTGNRAAQPSSARPLLRVAGGLWAVAAAVVSSSLLAFSSV